MNKEHETQSAEAVRWSALLAAVDREHLLAESNKEMDMKRKDYAAVYGWECAINGILKCRQIICEHIAANKRATGRELDGRTWDDLPFVRPPSVVQAKTIEGMMDRQPSNLETAIERLEEARKILALNPGLPAAQERVRDAERALDHENECVIAVLKAALL